MTGTRGAAPILRALLTVSVVGLVALAGCKPKAAPITAKKLVLPDSAEQMIFGFTAVLTDNGVNKGVLRADTAFLYQEPTGTRVELRRVRFTFFNAQGVDDGTMTGNEGTYRDALKRVEGRGRVIIQRKDGNRLETPQLVFDNARNQIYSDSSFTWTNPKKDILTGIGFESDPRLTNLRCMRSCKGKASVRVSGQ